jgi:serine/threonine-protein kinase HipA
VQGTPLDEEGVARVLRRIVAPTTGLVVDEDNENLFRLSIAGEQEKTALLWHEGRWWVPHGATPTTHLFKLPLGLVGNRKADMHSSLENEWLCSRILHAYGLPIANCRIEKFAEQKALVVTRFDRQLRANGQGWLRLPQEDFCQVCGVASHQKYEADGGPGLQDIAGILSTSENAKEDRETVLTAQLLFWLLAATDGHAKNFSIRLLPKGRFQLTPLYDVLSAWPIVGEAANKVSWHKAKLAMAVWGTNRHYRLKDVARRHFNVMAPICLQEASAEHIIGHIIASTPRVLANVQAELPAGFPAEVAETVLHGLQQSVHRLEAMPPQ